ncbi:hypothetical protein QFC19_008582 [Naganishia cerealis]|uniref:Uncharacterized protein n=1 Tax=Naganishia cerealis TaxID=610337 RepID=A0ACC2V0J2_9TREE|nr:hypothetical protein QFC19_008582 [Naganishia cerealis]
MADQSTQPKAKRQLIGFKQRLEINEQRARESAGTPDNVVSRKGFVAAAFALIIYAYYVFVGRLCAPMLQKTNGARGSVGEGVGLLIGFNILWLMFVWTYIKLVPKASAPEESMFTTTNTGTPYQYMGSGTATALPLSEWDLYALLWCPEAEQLALTIKSQASADSDGTSTLTPAQKYASAHRRSLNSSHGPLDDDDLDLDPSDLDGPRNMLPAEIPLFTHSRSKSHLTTAHSTPTLIQNSPSPVTTHQESMIDPSPSIDFERSGNHQSGSSNSKSMMGSGGGAHRVSDVSYLETCDSHTPLQPIAEAAPHGKHHQQQAWENTTLKS